MTQPTDILPISEKSHPDAGRGRGVGRMTTPTFRGFVRQTVPTSALNVGDRMYVIGLGLLCPIAKIDRGGEETALWFVGEINGRRRQFKMRRKTAGQSTIHVPEPKSILIDTTP